MNCLALWCGSKGKIPGIHYFCLTKNRHDSWLRALGRDPNAEHLSEKNVVCSRHFTQEDLCKKGNRIHLKPNAVPTLFLRKRDDILAQGCSRVLQEAPENTYTEHKESPQKTSGEMDDMEVLFVDVKENAPGGTILSTSIVEIESSPKSSTDSSTNSGSSTMNQNESSTDSEGYKGEIKRARRDIKVRHNYSASPSKLLSQVKDANVRKTAAQKKLKIHHYNTC